MKVRKFCFEVKSFFLLRGLHSSEEMDRYAVWSAGNASRPAGRQTCFVAKAGKFGELHIFKTFFSNLIALSEIIISFILSSAPIGINSKSDF